jgi:hypothetical protein
MPALEPLDTINKIRFVYVPLDLRRIVGCKTNRLGATMIERKKLLDWLNQELAKAIGFREKYAGHPQKSFWDGVVVSLEKMIEAIHRM